MFGARGGVVVEDEDCTLAANRANRNECVVESQLLGASDIASCIQYVPGSLIR